jgi:hypothetical protein
MNTALKFDRTNLKPTRPVVFAKERESTWENAMNLFGQGKFKESVFAVIDYANPIVRKKFGNAEQTHFEVAHGSAIVKVHVDNNTFKVEAPFLRLPENKIPLLRRINEINFGVLSLPQIYLKGEELIFSYECPLEMCYPYKVYDILREICSNADFFDDEFVVQFGARRITEPNVVPFDPNQKEKAWEKYNEYLAEAVQYIAYMENNRMDGFIWDILSIELRKIEYFVAPQGKLRNDIETAVKELNNGHINFNERLNNGRKFIAYLQSVTKEAFMEDLYLTDVFIPYKYYTRMENIKQNFNASIERAGQEFNGGNYMACTFTLQYDLMNLFYNYDLTPDVADFAERSLADASGKDWKEAAGILYNSLQNFVKNAN